MKIHFGVDYYPEHWPRERWETDARLMKEMGIQVVRMGEFSWHKFEPEEGKYDFSWLDEAIGVLGRYDIKTIVGTPTAAPPAWLINKHPDILPIDREGRTRGFGGRHHDCQSNLTYRKYISDLVERMTLHYALNPNVIGWQPDNELGNSHDELCTCDSCRRAFQHWLKKKYTSVEKLNEAWGTNFWSQNYNDFNEVFTPRITASGENPSMILDWRRFHSDLILGFIKLQIDIIRKNCPTHFITHNYMGFSDTVNYYKLADLLDFVSHDNYPGGHFAKLPQQDISDVAASLDVVRSYKNQSYWIMEEQSGITGWEVMGRAPKPGQLSAWAVQAIAHGADAVVYFRWRSCSFGTEEYWHGILPHSGNPGRSYNELKELSAKLAPIMDEMQGAVPKAEVGIIYSFDQEYALRSQPQNPRLSYTGQCLKYYKALHDHNVSVDFVDPERDFSQYRVLIAPLQYLMSPELEDKYFEYVKNGGRLVLTMRCGVKNTTNICMTERDLPGRLGELAGIKIYDYDCLNEADVDLKYNDVISKGDMWADIITPDEGTKVLAVYASDFYKDEAAITCRKYEKGACYYVGTEPREKIMEEFIRTVLKEADINKDYECSDNIEMVTKSNENGEWLFVINHSEAEGTYKVPDNFNLMIGNDSGTLAPFEYHIYDTRVKSSNHALAQ